MGNVFNILSICLWVLGDPSSLLSRPVYTCLDLRNPLRRLVNTKGRILFQDEKKQTLTVSGSLSLVRLNHFPKMMFEDDYIS